MGLKQPKVVACIPAFNEENTIGSVVVRALKFVYRVVVCDDGSEDLISAIAGGLGGDGGEGMILVALPVWSIRRIYLCINI